VRGRLARNVAHTKEEREQSVAEQPVTPEPDDDAGAHGPEPAAATATTADRVDDLRRRRAEADAPTGPDAAESQHRRGKLSARERLDLLLDPGSFVETDPLTRHRVGTYGLDHTRPPTDGVVTGWGTVDGRRVFVYSQDFTVFGGSLGEMQAKKICKVMDLAVETGSPLIGINDGGGARIQEGVASLGGYGDIFDRNVRASGVIPQISVIMGPCAGGAVYSPAITDFVYMVKGTSYMFITGPDVIKSVTGEDVTFEELGGASTHASRSGIASFVAEDEASCLAQVRYLLSFLPSNNLDDPPAFASTDDPDRVDGALNAIVPDSPRAPYDMKDVVKTIADNGELYEVFPLWAMSILTGFIRLDGMPIGVIANQPKILAGTLDFESSEKAARFVRFCDAFNIPITVFEDVPGFLPGTAQEYGGIIRRGAKLLYAFSEATVPKITVITRKAYGGAYVVMNSKHLRADLNLAWPTAEIAVMGSEGAVNIIHRRELQQADDPDARRRELIEEYEARFSNPYIAAELGYVDDVIEPAETRARLIRAFRMLRSKREPGPARKHGNIPL
jgi:acetyl-CoA carboxylase carboxyltransferase component